MNESIQKLADKCWINSFHFGAEGPRNTEEFDYEKFAKLIIEECALRAEAYAYMSPNFTALAEELREMK